MITQWVPVTLKYCLEYMTVIFGTESMVGGELCFYVFLPYATLHLPYFNDVAHGQPLFFTFTHVLTAHNCIPFHYFYYTILKGNAKLLT